MGRCALAVCLIVVALAGSAVAEKEPLPSHDVLWAHDQLTVHVARMPVADVLAAIAKQTGAELRGVPRVERDVSLDLEAASLDDALKRVLGEQNFTVRYGADGKPGTIELLGGPEAKPAAKADAGPAAAPAADRPALPIRLGFPRKFPSKRPLELPESLQKAAGTKTATFDEAFDLATLQSEGLTRAIASQVVLSQLERDRRVRRALLSAVNKFDDDTLASFRGTVEGERVQELLEFLSAHSRELSLQHKATIALDRFRAGTATPAN